MTSPVRIKGSSAFHMKPLHSAALKKHLPYCPRYLVLFPLPNSIASMVRFTAVAAAFVLLKPSHAHVPDEVHQGYEMLTDLITAHSTIWVIPPLRRLTFGAKLQKETKHYIDVISTNGSTRKKELTRLRQLDPPVLATCTDPNPRNKVMEEILFTLGSRVVKNTMLDLSDTFDVDFFLVQFGSCRLISSTAQALLKFEKNEERKKWLKEVSDQYKSLRNEMRSKMIIKTECKKKT